MSQSNRDVIAEADRKTDEWRRRVMQLRLEQRLERRRVADDSS